LAIDFFSLKRLVYAAPSFHTRQQMWHHYLRDMGGDDVAAEFGVWHGGSINYMANVRPLNAFHGFDTFTGLPEDWIRGHPKGHFQVDRAKLKFASNVTVHEGLFSATIPQFLTQAERSKITRLHIDCDLGSSTASVLAGLSTEILANKPLILFDEFYNYLGFEDHEFLAFLNFVEHTGVAFEVVGRNVNHQQVLIQIV
jgi:hypothetical protein